jgi:hypothetical protein
MDAVALEDGSPRDGSTPRPDAGGPPVDHVPNWSVRKRLRPALGDVTLEEVLTGFADPSPGATRIRRIGTGTAPEKIWVNPAETYISDFCTHPSGAFSAVLVATDRTVSVARLDADLNLLAMSQIHDPSVAHDPNLFDAGPPDLLATGFPWDAARIGAVDGNVLVAVFSTSNAVIAYRRAFANGAWGDSERTLVEPPVGITPFLPTGGSFDTFGAIVDSFRPLLDVDEAGNAYVAVWASPIRIRAHVGVFHDGLSRLPVDPNAPGDSASDILLTKLDRGGVRQWSRVVGTEHEDEPYALRARGGAVAVVGRARRFPGFDNTFWDALISVTRADGTPVGTRAIPLEASSIALAVDALPGGGWVVGGSDGWSQNPDGLSVLTFGTKLLLEIGSFDAGLPVRLPLPAGPRHNEVRTLVADGGRIWYGGHEDGPVMHTGDGDPSLIRATGVLGSVPE